MNDPLTILHFAASDALRDFRKARTAQAKLDAIRKYEMLAKAWHVLREARCRKTKPIRYSSNNAIC